jgi:2-hydroxyglutarate dehydrogenase
VLEREAELASHQTGHSSGVVHAGIYYPPGSLKAQLCVEGARELYRYCAKRSIAIERCGKVILATKPSELTRLAELERRGRANGVTGLRLIDPASIARLEPNARGISGLHSPHTGVVDFLAVARAYARDVRDAGGSISTSCEVTEVKVNERSVCLVHPSGTTTASYVIFCAGAWADRLATAAGADPDPRIVPFRGAYLELVPERRDLVRGLIYPVPDPSLPFLGVHFTRHIDGRVLIGPTATVALARDAYSARKISVKDIIDTATWPGTWRLLSHRWRSGLGELRDASLPSALVRAAARYVPEIAVSDVRPAFAGVRAQALRRDGTLVDDFVFSATERALHVRNAPSPAASASLAIARHVADELERSFNLGF